MSTITDVNNGDSGLVARTTINDNFDNLNTDKIEDDSVDTLTNKTLTAPVINSPTGIVKGDVGLGNVDNTSDASKPISTDTQTALDAKVDDTDIISITKGGSGETTQQAAIDSLTDVSSASNEQVLTKDTGTGNAIYKAIPSAGLKIERQYLVAGGAFALTFSSLTTVDYYLLEAEGGTDTSQNIARTASCHGFYDGTTGTCGSRDGSGTTSASFSDRIVDLDIPSLGDTAVILNSGLSTPGANQLSGTLTVGGGLGNVLVCITAFGS